MGVRRDKAALSSRCEPTRQPLQPEVRHLPLRLRQRNGSESH